MEPLPPHFAHEIIAVLFAIGTPCFDTEAYSIYQQRARKNVRNLKCGVRSAEFNRTSDFWLTFLEEPGYSQRVSLVAARSGRGYR